MGSSKKHSKDKERDREHKHKHRHRSRSGSRERRHREKDRDRHERHRERSERDRSETEQQEGMVIDYGHSSVAAMTQEQTQRQLPDPAAADFPVPSSSGGTISMSIDQTNELRAKLGLKPLELDDGNKSGSLGGLNDDVHVPAVNIAQVKRTEALREKMNVMRDKREISGKLGKVKTLGESDSEEEVSSTMSWVARSRLLEEQKRQAEQRAKMLEEMDAEFGVSGLLDEEFGKKSSSMYSSRDLKGLRVEHDQQMFKEGKTVILTLKDKGILDEDNDDTLINVNILDDERALKNVENRKKKPMYQPYDEPEFDEYGMLRPKDVLDKYDEVIEGPRKESFMLDHTGKYDTLYERNMEQMKADIRSQSDTLLMPAPLLASEFFTPAEVTAAKFKKMAKKPKKLRKKAVVTADDLVGLEQDYSGDLGSRNLKRRRIARDEEEEEPVVKREVPVPIPGLDLVKEEPNEDPFADPDDIDATHEDLTGVVIDEDSAALELEMALSKARKLNQKKQMRDRNEVVFKTEPTSYISENKLQTVDSSMTLNSTSEFCRSLGDIPTYGRTDNREEEEEDDDLMEIEGDDDRDKDSDEEAGGLAGWQSVQIDDRPVDITSRPESKVLDDEPVVNKGIGSALLLAGKKGYLEKEKLRKAATVKPSTVTELKAINYSIEDKKIEEDDKFRKRDRYICTGGSMEFKEKEGYKPDVKLEYVDEAGRPMSMKEAFRLLSHRFHGKGSGKKKLEKRMKKVDEEQLMKSMSSTDTPLHTVQLLQDRQKADKSHYVVISGGKGFGSNSLTK